MSEHDPKDLIKQAGEQARSSLAGTVEMVKDAASEAGGAAQDFAREAGRQAASAAESLYGQGNELRGVVERAVVDYPWGALAIAGAIGYGMACLINRR